MSLLRTRESIFIMDSRLRGNDNVTFAGMTVLGVTHRRRRCHCGCLECRLELV